MNPAAATPSRGGGILDALSPASGAHHSRARRGAPDRAAAAERAAADDVTINTRLAVADLDAMLASPSAGLATQPARGQGVFQPGAPKMRPATSPQPQAMSFAVFVEEDDDSPPRAADPSRRAPAAAAGAGSAASFAVYDENEAAGSSARAPSRGLSAAPSSARAAGTGGGGFTVFEDEPSTRQRQHQRQQPPKPAPVWKPVTEAGPTRGRRAALGSVPLAASPRLSPIAGATGKRGPGALPRPGTVVGSLATPAAPRSSSSSRSQSPDADFASHAVAALNTSVTTRDRGAHGRRPLRRAAPASPAPAAAAGSLAAPSFGIFSDSPAAAAGPGDGHAGRPVFADENAPSENAPGAMRPAAQRSIRDPRVAAGALRSLPVPEAPPSRRPSHRDALRAAQTGGSVDAGGSFVIFQDGLSDAAAQRAAESARDAFDE